MTKFKVLDVGCGDFPRGDVNVDLYPEPTIHRTDAKAVLKGIPNFINCDAQFLPFKDNSFDIVRSYGVIEHVDKPYLMLKELIRVSNRKIIVNCPHRYGKTGRSKGHKNYFSRTWFVDALKKIKENSDFHLYFRTDCWHTRQFPLIMVPEDMIIQMVKGKQK